MLVEGLDSSLHANEKRRNDVVNDDMLIDPNEQLIDQDEIRGAVIITDVINQHATVTKKTGHDTSNDGEEKIEFEIKYSITTQDDDDKINNNGSIGTVAEDLSNVSPTECTVVTDKSHIALLITQPSIDNDAEPIEGVGEERDTLLSSVRNKEEDSDRIHERKQECKVTGQENEDKLDRTVVDLTNDEDDNLTNIDNEKDNITELPDTNYPSLRHLPKQQTIENVIKSNEELKYGSLKRDPSLAWDDFQTSYSEGDSYYSDQGDDKYHVNTEQNKDPVIEEFLKNNQNILTDDDQDSGKNRHARMKDCDSASDKATEMYESVENDSLSSEGDEQHSTAAQPLPQNIQLSDDHPVDGKLDATLYYKRQIIASV